MEFLSTFLFIFLLMGLFLVKGILKNLGKSSFDKPQESEQSIPEVFRQLMQGEFFQESEVECKQTSECDTLLQKDEEKSTSAAMPRRDAGVVATKANQPIRRQYLPLHTKEDIKRAVLYAEIIRRKY